MVSMTPQEQRAKERICLALDFPTVAAALKTAQELQEYVGMVKVGQELHTQAGMEGVNIFKELVKRGCSHIFFDAKFHDIPSTVYGAVKAAVAPGIEIINVHIAGGEAMCKMALRAAAAGALQWGMPVPKIIGVTILTSLNETDLVAEGMTLSYQELLLLRAKQAQKWGLQGIVCPANQAGRLEQEFGKKFLYVTPGIQFAADVNHTQKQLITPPAAVASCSSSLLVIGSAILSAADKQQRVREILRSMTAL